MSGARLRSRHAAGGADVRLTFIDFETAWGADYTLSKMTTDGYITDPRFKVFGAALATGGAAPVWAPEPQLGDALRAVDWSTTAVVAHNMAFDGFILTQHYGVRPAFLIDTVSMARAVLPPDQRVSLAALAKYYGLPDKGHAVMDTKGKWELPDSDLRALGEYCEHDVWLCREVYKRLAQGFPVEELKLIDLTLRMFVDPVVRLDAAMLRQEVFDERQRKEAVVQRVCDGDRTRLMSNARFAEALMTLGVVPPRKVSPRTGKETWAFARTDEGFRELLGHPSPEVQALAQARADVKSTIAETRAARMLEVADGNRPWPVMLNYCGARNTNRWSGGNKSNAQNMPSGRDGKPPVLRNSIMAPDGYSHVVVDSSQIEARMLAVVAGQHDLVEVFRTGGDPYGRQASILYGETVVKGDPRRHVGKVLVLGCGYGMSGPTFRLALKAMTGIDISEAEATDAVRSYRASNPAIPQLWRRAESWVKEMAHGAGYEWGCLRVIGSALAPVPGVYMPNGLTLQYPGLAMEETGEWTYRNASGKSKLYGGKLVENIIQGLARIVVAEQMLVLEQVVRRLGGRVWLMAHDEVCMVVPTRHAEQMLKVGIKVMSTPPKWLPQLPVGAEGGVGLRYGEVGK